MTPLLCCCCNCGFGCLCSSAHSSNSSCAQTHEVVLTTSCRHPTHLAHTHQPRQDLCVRPAPWQSRRTQPCLAVVSGAAWQTSQLVPATAVTWPNRPLQGVQCPGCTAHTTLLCHPVTSSLAHTHTAPVSHHSTRNKAHAYAHSHLMSQCEQAHSLSPISIHAAGESNAACRQQCAQCWWWTHWHRRTPVISRLPALRAAAQRLPSARPSPL